MALTQSNLDATARDSAGKGSARKTRMAGLIPAIVYGKHLKEPIKISVNAKAVRVAVQTKKKLNTVIALKVGATTHNVMLKDYQQDPVSKASPCTQTSIDVTERDQMRRSPGEADGKARRPRPGRHLVADAPRARSLGVAWPRFPRRSTSMSRR